MPSSHKGCKLKKRTIEHSTKIQQALLGKKRTSEFKAKISKATTGTNNPFFGKHHTEETKNKIRLARLGHKLSEETKAKISLSETGVKNRWYGVKGDKHPAWKGNHAGIQAAHDRARVLYPCPKGKQRHHIDGNPYNNNPENIAFLTQKKHSRIDGRAEKIKRVWVGKKRTGLRGKMIR